jgi:hypothetical protein
VSVFASPAAVATAKAVTAAMTAAGFASATPGFGFSDPAAAAVFAAAVSAPAKTKSQFAQAA